MKNIQATTADNAVNRPRPMKKGKLASLALGTVGLAIAVGPCTYIAEQIWQEPLGGSVISTDVKWTDYPNTWSELTESYWPEQP